MDDPVRVTLDVVASGAMLYDQIWLGSYMVYGFVLGLVLLVALLL